jgi:hypothetical protein
VLPPWNEVFFLPAHNVQNAQPASSASRPSRPIQHLLTSADASSASNAARAGSPINTGDAADRERDTELLKGRVGPTGRPVGAKGTPGVPSKGGTDRQAAQLATRRPDRGPSPYGKSLAEAVSGARSRTRASLASSDCDARCCSITSAYAVSSGLVPTITASAMANE